MTAAGTLLDEARHTGAAEGTQPAVARRPKPAVAIR
jgi:hypothetical protein